MHQANPAGEYAHADLFLDWQGARELVARGVAIGSHTLDHCILAREDDAHQCSCLARSRRLLHDELNVPAEMVAFPSGQRGDYSRRTIEIAQKAGYVYAFTTWGGLVTGSSNPFEISRIAVSTDVSPPDLIALIFSQLNRKDDSCM